MPPTRNRMFEHKVDVYHFINPSSVIVAINTDCIWPEVPSGERAYPRSDGWWGPHEYALLPQPYDSSSPYMAWIPSLDAYDSADFSRLTGLDPTIVMLNFSSFPLVPSPDHFKTTHIQLTTNPRLPIHPSLPTKPGSVTGGVKKPGLDFCSASDAMRRVVKTQVDTLSERVGQVVADLGSDPSHRIRLPEQALFHLKQAYYWNLLPGTNTECGHHLILAGMKRAAMELHGFILWHRDYKASLNQARPIVRKYQKWYRSRGAVVSDEEDYAYLARRDIPAWMTIDAHTWKPNPSARAVCTTPIPIHRDPMFPPGYKGGHHTAILFYPPEAEDPFELSARGYAGRRDVYELHTEIARIHDKMHDKQRTIICDYCDRDIDASVVEIEAGLYFPRLKGPINHLIQMYQKDYDNIQPFSPVPPLFDWVRGRQQMDWPMASQFAGTTTSRPPPIRTAMPPPLFFFRCSHSMRQESYFFVWMTMRERWIQRFTASDVLSRQSFFKTHQQWRDILSGALFKKESYQGVEYNLNSFWHSYPQLLFDDVKDATNNLVPILTNGIPLDPTDFNDSNHLAFRLKRLLCYDIAVTHIKHQFEETDDIIIRDLGFRPNRQARRRAKRSDLFRSSIRLPSVRPPWEDLDLATTCLWFERFRFFLRDWPAVGSGEHLHLATKFTDISSHMAFDVAVNELLTVYYSGVVKKLNVVPTLMWKFPEVEGLDRYLSI